MAQIHPDTFLLDRLRQGDTNAFKLIFQKYYPLLCAYGHRFVQIETAEEIAGDTLLWVWEHRHEEIIKSSLVKYMFKIVYRKSLNYIELKQTQLKADTHYYQDSTINILEETDLCEINELSQKIYKAISELPETYREAFILHRFKNMTYKEIAEHLNVSTKSVDYKIQQAIKILSKELKDYLPIISLLFGDLLEK